MLHRLMSPRIIDALGDSPVVLLNGARQTGKTTLVQNLPRKDRATYISLDEAGYLSAALADPAGFVSGMTGPVIIDEVQHAPELFRAIKLAVDRRRTAGRFLLTGSANVLLLPRLAESLAGRMEILTLWPLAQAEIESSTGSLVDRLFGASLPTPGRRASEGAELVRRVLGGGYPEPLARAAEMRRKAWFNSYLTTILQRDVRDLANIEGLATLPRLLALLASRAGGLLNLADVSRAISLPYATLHRYIALLEATFLVRLLPAWNANLGRRLVKAPKLLLNDTGLIANLLGLNAGRLAGQRNLLGGLMENFVAMELLKDAGWSSTQPQLFHFRTQAGQEVDVVLEDAAGRVVGVETKASTTVVADDFKGLRHLAELVGDRFVRGVVMHTGDQTVPFAANLHAMPISELWRQI